MTVAISPISLYNPVLIASAEVLNIRRIDVKFARGGEAHAFLREYSHYLPKRSASLV